MTIQSADYLSVCTDVDTEFRRGTVGAQEESYICWQDIAAEKSAANGSVTYASGNNAPAIQAKGAAYTFSEMAVNTFKVKSQRWGAGLKISVDDLNDDIYGVFLQTIADLGFSSIRFPQTLIWTWLREGDQTVGPSSTLFTGRDMTDIDGLAFFSASKKVNLNDSGKGTQANLLTSTALTSANYEVARKALVEMKNTNGEPCGFQPTHIYVPPALSLTAANIILADTLSGGGVNVQANGSGPVMKRPKVTIVEVPELAADGTIWYLASKTSIGAPIVYQVTDPFHLVPKVDPTSSNVFYDDMLEWLEKGRSQVGWGDYRRIVRCAA